ncbi:hypothetical protein A1353_22330 [Methylomonas methanica]|uniref:Uncharacterized protein n=1 Tax=Methylomonas methanica TaxID=421 RepID=A0A177LXH6_METMH|nr:hypothetical protein A1353_22330 [Methylomonas methanica]
MFEAVSIVIDLLISVFEFVFLCLKFILKKVGFSEKEASKTLSRFGWLVLVSFVLLVIGIIIEHIGAKNT